MRSGRAVPVPLQEPLGRYAPGPRPALFRRPDTLRNRGVGMRVQRRSGCNGIPAGGAPRADGHAPTPCLDSEPAYSPDGIRCRGSVLAEAGEGACGPLQSPRAA